MRGAHMVFQGITSCRVNPDELCTNQANQLSWSRSKWSRDELTSFRDKVRGNKKMHNKHVDDYMLEWGDDGYDSDSDDSLEDSGSSYKKVNTLSEIRLVLQVTRNLYES
jgi:hypothetical protein